MSDSGKLDPRGSTDPFVIDVNAGPKAAEPPAADLAPRVIDTGQSGPVSPIKTMRAAQPAVPIQDGSPARRTSWTVLAGAIGVAILGFGWMFVRSVDWIVDTYGRSPTLGVIAAVSVMAGVSGILVIVMHELRSLFAIKNVEAVQNRLAGLADRLQGADAQRAIHEVLAIVPKDAETDAAIAKFHRQISTRHTPAQQIEILSQTVLEPLDRRAEAAVRRAAGRAFGITAISPAALTDALFFLAASFRMMRAIASAYGHRPTAAIIAHLLKRLVLEAGRIGGVDMAATSLTYHLGGAFAERVASKTAESLYAAQRMARLGIIITGMCRPIPFRADQVPTLSSLVGNLFRRATSEDSAA
jgi:putative membrane protein